MAQAVAQVKAKQRGIKAVFASAGLYAMGDDTSNSAQIALGLKGISFCKKSELLTKKLADEADLIFGITASHAENIKRAFPKAAHKVMRFPTEIPDPYGGDISVYKACLESISDGVDKLFDNLEKGEYNGI